MSEYQYYEFLAVDRPLTREEMGHMRAISSRARITPTRFTNHYEWGDFKGDVGQLIERYYDAFVYVANWGTREFSLRLPASVFPADAAAPYMVGQPCTVREAGGFTVVDFCTVEDDSDDDPDAYLDDGTRWMSSLLPVRAELAAGDYRALYLGWLVNAMDGGVDPGETEPPVLPGLRTPTVAQKALAAFLRIDRSLIAAAAETSADPPPAPSADDLAAWIGGLAGSEKDRLLLRVATGEERAAAVEMRHAFAAASRPGPGAELPKRRTRGEIWEAAERRREQRERAAALRAEREKARRREARQRYLDSLVGDERVLWSRIDGLVASTKPAAYAEAIPLIVDLRDLADREGRIDDFDSLLVELRQKHHKKQGFLARLNDALSAPPE